jgi:hypothetical protein
LWLVRRLERWLHQHLFKVGWLLSRRLATTTVLYYLLFFPGIVVYEVTVWFTATLINLRAELAFRIPEEQAAAELRLEFVRLGRTNSRLKRGALALAPILVGMLVIWAVAAGVLRIPQSIAPLSAGGLEAVPQAVRAMAATPGFWLWTYVMFTIANTMFPRDSRALRIGRGWWLALGALVVVALANNAISPAVAQWLTDAVILIVEVLLIVAGLNLFATALLALLEAVIERVTGASATFQNGRLVAMSRQEVLQAKAQEREKREKTARALAALPRSVYELPLPLPAAVAKEAPVPVTAPPVLNAAQGKAGAAMISAQPLRVESTPIADDASDEESS